MSECRYCGEEIIWKMTVNGRPVALDPEPVSLSDFPDQVYSMYNGRAVRVQPEVFVWHESHCVGAQASRAADGLIRGSGAAVPDATAPHSGTHSLADDHWRGKP